MEFISDLYLKKQPPATVLVDEENHIYRARAAADGLIDMPMMPKLGDDERTLRHLWLKATEENASKRIFGARPVIQVHTKEIKTAHHDKKKWVSYELGDYKWWDYQQARDLSIRTAALLRSHDIGSKDRVFFFAKTSAPWMITAQASFLLGASITTGYDSMPADAIASIIDQTEPKAIFTETTLLKVVMGAYELLDKKKHVPLVLYVGTDEGANDLSIFKDKMDKSTTTLVSLQAMYDGTEDEEAHENDVHDLDELMSAAIAPNDLALIMFTSGTQGTPKGVQLTHANILAAIGGAHHLIVDWLLQDDHIYIGYLPLAHVLEFVVELVMITLAIPIGYAGVRTLMGESVTGPQGQGKGKGDLACLQPTILAGVPAVWERIKKGVENELDKKGWAVRSAFHAAMELKWQMLQYFGKENRLTRMLDSTVFAPLRHLTGGHLIYGLSGGAPISLETQKFVSSALCYMVQGYGLTECCGLASLTYPALGATVGIIGPPSPSIEFKFMDVPDTDYKAANGTGELLLRGPSLMTGYYKLPDITKEAMTPDGWFRTGDVARLNDDGTVKIIDRAKYLVKLNHGEYIALENIESKYRGDCRQIKNICVIAWSSKDYIIAVVEPTDDDVEKASLLKDLQATAKKTGCNRAETVKDIIVTRNVNWMEEYATTSGKIKRRDVEKAHEEEINNLYK
ncbi:hypothetical protein BC940DRAFT_265133 [Gongronella butleri]|nr:hypothetical protein BC940DRAFT_265133 [Gongronella butleri]